MLAATRVVGKIHHECHVSPANWKTYRDIMRKRVHEADRPTRSVQVLGQSSQPVFAPGASSGMPASDFSSFIVRICLVDMVVIDVLVDKVLLEVVDICCTGSSY
jgi:hypothetical protein